MKRHKKEKITYTYECSLSGEEFVMSAKAPNPKDLLTVKAYYEMHPEMDDRPAIIKKKLGITSASETNH